MFATIKMWWCLTFHNSLNVIENFGNASQKVECTKCKAQYGINHNVKAVLPWDKELEELHKLLKEER